MHIFFFHREDDRVSKVSNDKKKSFQIQYMLEVTIINPWIKWPFTSLSQGVKIRLSPPLNEPVADV